ncbi:MAG: glycerate kinase [Bacilli bacterium]|jgi:glycerate kinase|nr:glycerate kinase [Bacilli bacterium]HHU24272.1 glycerate kinase [Acholeplasmataceae bacterium]
MRVLSIIDSFKGTLTSVQLGQIATSVFTKKGIDAKWLPISDGGDGFLDTIENIVKTKRVKIKVLDPLGRATETYYLLDENKREAYIEMAKCSGINLLVKEELNPFITSTYGLGQAIHHAIAQGIPSITVGIGGSATNDGGSGMLEALGCKFYDKNRQLIKNMCGGKLDLVQSIDPSALFETIKGVEFIVLSDVTNPLLKEKGASFVYAKQKGASVEDLPILEAKMENYALVMETYFKKQFRDKPGAGAAGGVGYAFHSLFKAEFHSGIDYILDLVDFENLIKDFDYLITGEGKIDRQSLAGKVIIGITKRAISKKIICVCALSEISLSDLNNPNIVGIYSIVGRIASKEESMQNPQKYFAKLCEEIIFA